MSEIIKSISNPLTYFGWLRIPLFWWVRTKLVPEDPKRDLNLDPNQPVVYVLPHRSLSDLLVLYFYCIRLGLPLPNVSIKSLRRGINASYLYMQKLGLFQPKRSGNPPTQLQNICRRLEREKNLNIQLVPVSIIWGRNPGKKEKSLFKLLFPDDEHAGLIHKFFIVMAQGRDTVVHFGRPISMREQIEAGPNVEQVARKLRRVLRVHFRTQRNITLGPKSYDRNRLIGEVFNSKQLQQAIDLEAAKSKVPRQKIEEKAYHYLREISSSQSHSMIRFFDVLLTYVWNKIYDGIMVRHGEPLRDLANTHEIVYVVSHRSHLDYLVLPYELYYMGLTTPHTAAGINLSFWPVGPFLRRGGAFFIRRSFRGNRLYAVAFTSYLAQLLSKGHSIAFFPEGGRSRTGRLLTPKTGMLSMIVQSYLRYPVKPLAFVPVYIGYDKVAEVKSYLGELMGASKKKESLKEFLKVRRVLKAQHGRAYLAFGKAFLIDKRLDEANPTWRAQSEKIDSKAEWLTGMIDQLAVDLMKGINSAAVVNPVSLVALALLSSPQRAMAKEDLESLIDVLLQLLRCSSVHPQVTLPKGDRTQIISYAESVANIRRFEYPGGGGDVMYLDEIDSAYMTYYRNNILHLFALSSLIGCYFQYSERVSLVEIEEGAMELYPFLRDEFFLQWSMDEVKAEISRLIEGFVDLGLLYWNEDKSVLSRPGLASNEFANLKVIGRILGLVFERYAISTAMLASLADRGALKRPEFEASSQSLARRISLLNGVSHPEFYDRALFRSFVDMLKKFDYLSDDQDGGLRINSKIHKLALRCSALLSPDLWESIQKLTLDETGGTDLINV